MPAQTPLPGDGSWRDADRPVTARFSWSQTMTEPGHGRVRRIRRSGRAVAHRR